MKANYVVGPLPMGTPPRIEENGNDVPHGRSHRFAMNSTDTIDLLLYPGDRERETGVVSLHAEGIRLVPAPVSAGHAGAVSGLAGQQWVRGTAVHPLNAMSADKLVPGPGGLDESTRRAAATAQGSQRGLEY